MIHQLGEFHKVSLLIISAVTAADVWRVELETKVHSKVRNHGEGPY